jgi:hypothetical protein
MSKFLKEEWGIIETDASISLLFYLGFAAF